MIKIRKNGDGWSYEVRWKGTSLRDMATFSTREAAMNTARRSRARINEFGRGYALAMEAEQAAHQAMSCG